MTDKPFAWRTMIAGSLGLGLIAVTTVASMPIRLVWNASESVPLGLYAVHTIEEIRRADLVLARPPKPIAEFLADGGYVPLGVPLLKHVAALAGQKVCRAGLDVTVDGEPLAKAREYDRMGRSLPHWDGCRTLTSSEVFLVNWDEPASLDGRYFGPLPISSIVGRATPVWTDEER